MHRPKITSPAIIRPWLLISTDIPFMYITSQYSRLVKNGGHSISAANWHRRSAALPCFDSSMIFSRNSIAIFVYPPLFKSYSTFISAGFPFGRYFKTFFSFDP
jgi:hypothetical protein